MPPTSIAADAGAHSCAQPTTVDSRSNRIITPLHGIAAILSLLSFLSSSLPPLSRPFWRPPLGVALSPLYISIPPVFPPLEMSPSPRSASLLRSGVRVLLWIPERLCVSARQSMLTGLGVIVQGVWQGGPMRRGGD